MNASSATTVNVVRAHIPVFLIAAFVAAAVLALQPAPASPSGSLHARSSAAQVTVVMTEFRFVLSAPSVRTGVVVFRLVNRGHIPHDFEIANKKSALIAPGGHGLLRVGFRRPGNYPYLCTVPGHAQAGMKGVLKVTR